MTLVVTDTDRMHAASRKSALSACRGDPWLSLLTALHFSFYGEKCSDPGFK